MKRTAAPHSVLGCITDPQVHLLFCNLVVSSASPDSNSPHVVKKPPVGSSEEWNTKRPSDDTVSTISSLHSSPTVSPQGSPRKGLQWDALLVTLCVSIRGTLPLLERAESRFSETSPPGRALTFLSRNKYFSSKCFFSFWYMFFAINRNRKSHLATRVLFFTLKTKTFIFISPFPSSFSVGGVAKSQNSSQMNLSGSSSSLTSDASTKAGTVSLRSYGIGGASLHKRLLLLTMQQKQQSSSESENQTQEEEEEERTEVEKERGMSPSEQRQGRKRFLLRARAESPYQRSTGVLPVLPTGSPGSPPGPGPSTLSPTSQPELLMSPKPPDFLNRKRLLSPFRNLRRRSQSREKLLPVRPHLDGGEASGKVESSPAQDERQEQAVKRAMRSVSPNPFLWLCRDRPGTEGDWWSDRSSHLLSKTVIQWNLEAFQWDF